MIEVIKIVLGFLTGGLTDKFFGFLNDREKMRLESASEERRQAYADAADARATAMTVRLATAGYLEMRVMTALVLFFMVSHLGMTWFDTMWPQPWNVEKFPDPIDDYQWQIILSLFGLGAVHRGINAAATVAAIITKRKVK